MTKHFHYSKATHHLHHLHHLLLLDIHFFQLTLTNTAGVSCGINATKLKGTLM